jgi:hypothetical protein
MKTTKQKSRPGKSSIDKKAMTNDNASIMKSGPGEEEIREKAEEIYNQRIDRGEYGTAADDWQAAEEYLRDSRN